MSSKKPTVLVTGGCGFIGSHLVDQLIKKGFHLVVIDKTMRWMNEQATYHKCDILSPRMLEILKAEKPLYVFHLAAQTKVPKSVEDPLFDAKVNILGTLNLLEGCRKLLQLKRFIFFSTGGAIYSDRAKRPTSEAVVPLPVSPYGTSKFSAEHYLDFYHRVYGLSYLALRPANVYGPRQSSGGDGGVVSIFLRKLFDHSPVVIEGTGEETRDFVYVDDVVTAAVKAAGVSFVGAVNIGTGKEVSINRLFDLAKKYTGSKQPKIYSKLRIADVRHSLLDPSRAKRQLDWIPRVGIEEGLKKTVAWFKQRKK
jgi:UDP-glucose 4-epimerase